MIDTRVLTGAELDAALEDVARLRIKVFRDWPYLYDGDLTYEQDYLQTYRKSADAILVGAFDGATLIGAATGTPMLDHADDFSTAFESSEIDLSSLFYCAESVLLPEFRGQGVGHRFFDLRETHAKDLGFSSCCFCGVMRSATHPLRPENYAPLDPFWRKRGYQPLKGVIAHFSWKDINEDQETRKRLQFWFRSL